jgi:tight adherence protein B
LAAAIILGLIFTTRRRALLGTTDTSPSGEQHSDLAEKAIQFAEVALDGSDRRGGLPSLLERAGSTLRPGEFMLMTVSGTIVFFALGFFALGLLGAILLAAFAAIGARVLLEVKATKRQEAFADQLGDNLQLIAGSVRAGYGLVQAIDTVGHEALSPTAEEFRRIVAEINLGRDTGEALRASAERTKCEDFTWVVEAMDVHRAVGGDLSELLESVASTIRERTQLRRKVQALSAEGRLSAIVLLALPFAIGGFVTVSNPGYMDELYKTGIGQGLIVTGLVLMGIGVYWMRRVIDLDY